MYTRTVIRTSLTVEQATERLSGLVGTAFDSDRPFVGTVKDRRFKFHRTITGTRGFEVVVTGVVVAAPAGAELQAVVRVAIPVVIFQVACIAASLTALSMGGIIEVTLIVLLSLSALVLSAQFFVQERRRTVQALRGVGWVDSVPPMT